MHPADRELGTAYLAVLQRYAEPRALLRPGPRALLRPGRARLTALIVKASNNHQGAARAAQWLAVVQAALDLYG